MFRAAASPRRVRRPSGTTARAICVEYRRANQRGPDGNSRFRPRVGRRAVRLILDGLRQTRTGSGEPSQACCACTSYPVFKEPARPDRPGAPGASAPPGRHAPTDATVVWGTFQYYRDNRTVSTPHQPRLGGPAIRDGLRRFRLSRELSVSSLGSRQKAGPTWGRTSKAKTHPTRPGRVCQPLCRAGGKADITFAPSRPPARVRTAAATHTVASAVRTSPLYDATVRKSNRGV